MRQIQYLPAQIIKSSSSPLQKGKSITRGWNAVRLGSGQDQMLLKWSAAAYEMPQTAMQESRLRITAALDYRDAQQVKVFLGQSNEEIGRIDIRFAYVFQPFELKLSAEYSAKVLLEGVRLELTEGTQPLWIFNDNNSSAEQQLFVPHLMVGQPASRTDEALHTMLSLSSLQPFGWMEGCVLDGLYSLRGLLGAQKVDPVLDLHFKQFFNEQGDLLYEDLHGRQADGKFTTIEATLPLAVITKYQPEHPVIQKALQFFESKGLNQGTVVMDGDLVSAEGSYTVAYPLAVIANRFQRLDLARQAVAQILLRRDHLARQKHVYLRYTINSKEHTFRSWARAFAWYCLGLVKTSSELKSSSFAHLPGIDAMEAEIVRIAEVVKQWRSPSGLWTVFLDEDSTGIDTSGSAGISAALAIAASNGLLPESYMDIARHNLAELSAYLTPDGILHGAAQHNAGGMELQTGGYRVCSQMGLGLWAQLYASVHSNRPI